MPPLIPAVEDADAAALAAYVRILSPGYELYVRFCANCHGDDGRGAENLTATKTQPIVLDEAYFTAHDHEQVENGVWHMMREKKPQMPHLRRNVSETAAQAIIKFLKSLQD
jgi:mono/diheme cytochrome c family protein